MDASSKILKNYRTKNERFWAGQNKKLTLDLFHRMAKDLPAYRKFLRQVGIKPSKVKNSQDLALVPTINKANYFHQHKLGDVTWPNFLAQQSGVMTATSGSTGLPTYFVRSEHLDWQYSVLAEYFLQNGKPGKTLFMDCFGMGVWIGGLMTYQAFRYAGLRGYPLTIITPGINKKEIFHALRDLAPQFDQVIIAGYPPFVKDVVDEAALEGVNLKQLNLRLLFAAEGFSEKFRDYLARHTGIKDVFHDTLNIYGSAELGAMAFETPTSILIRRLLLKNPAAFRQLFPLGKVPTLGQYNPEFINFSERDGQILISADAAVPMLHYAIGDNGGVLTLSKIQQVMAEHGINLNKEAKKHKVKLLSLPFVYVYERSDFSTKLYGAIIYPEHVREALQDRKVAHFVTGKFAMVTKFDAKQNQFLEINVELQPKFKATPAHKKLCHDLIVKSLLKNNAEYKNNHSSIPKKVLPQLVFWNYGDPTFFPGGIKQKWVKK